MIYKFIPLILLYMKLIKLSITYKNNQEIRQNPQRADAFVCNLFRNVIAFILDGLVSLWYNKHMGKFFPAFFAIQKGTIMQFNQLNLSQEILSAVDELGFTEMTEIQEKSIPLLLNGTDVVGRSNTGTGKTAAFVIPAVESITQEDSDKVCVLILCPTRELAMQACEEIRKFAKFKKCVKASAVYGGASMEKQIHELKRGANIVVGTPGRVMDHMRRRTLRIDSLRTVILDEADEMLNMGFREDIETILASVPEDRQTVLFSATMPPEILAITEKYQRDPVQIKIKSAQKTVELIEQYSFEIAMGRKTDALKLLLAAYFPKSSMVFCNTKKNG